MEEAKAPIVPLANKRRKAGMGSQKQFSANVPFLASIPQ